MLVDGSFKSYREGDKGVKIPACIMKGVNEGAIFVAFFLGVESIMAKGEFNEL